jgi:hypothetical protein
MARDASPRVRITGARRRQVVRNLIIYTVGVMTLSTVGGIVLAGGAEVGALVFVIGPLLMAVLLRTFGGDGWTDAGLRLGALRWYPFAFLIFPVTFGLILGGGALTGSIAFTGTVGALLTAAALELAPRLVFAGFEEWGWRGYLEPRLAAFGVPDLRCHFLVGLIWAVWHIPYILNTPGYSELPPLVFAPLLLGSVMAMAVVYGQLRRASGSVWPVVIAHAGAWRLRRVPAPCPARHPTRQPALHRNLGGHRMDDDQTKGCGARRDRRGVRSGICSAIGYEHVARERPAAHERFCDTRAPVKQSAAF